MKHIISFHLFNDFSGSPKVLYLVLKGLLERGCLVDLISSRGGALDALETYPNLKKHSYRYKFSSRTVITMLRYLFVQFYTFIFAFRYVFAKDCVFYINTLLPVGPALAGRMMGKRVVYHYHENAFVKGGFYRALAWAMQHLAHEIICVSAYQASFLKQQKKVTVIPNALPQDFVSKLHPNPGQAFERKTVLMLSSLKAYKGTREFVLLAKRLPQFRFIIVINDTSDKIADSLKEVPVNLAVYARQKDVSTFYNKSSIVVNLTDSRIAIETFGLTALEAMRAGLPVIVPTLGGIAELVEDGVNGYKIDVQELEKVAAAIRRILTDEELYRSLADNALKCSQRYDAERMVKRIEKELDK